MKLLQLSQEESRGMERGPKVISWGSLGLSGCFFATLEVLGGSWHALGGVLRSLGCMLEAFGLS